MGNDRGGSGGRALMGGTQRERTFGFTVGGAVMVVAAIAAWKGHALPARLASAAGGALVLLGWVRPAWLRPLEAAWRRLSHALGWVNTRVLLTVLFFGVVTPIAVVMRWSGRDLLRRRGRTPLPGTSWEPYPAARRGAAHYERLS